MNILKFTLYFILIYLISVLFDITAVTSLFTSGINYITTSPIGTVLNSIVEQIGWLFDQIFLGTGTYTSHFGFYSFSFVWFQTILRVVLVVFFFKILIKVVFD